MMKQQMRFYTLATIYSMLWNAHGTSSVLLNTQKVGNSDTIKTVQQNATTQNTVPKATPPTDTVNLFDTKRFIANGQSLSPRLSRIEKISLATGLGVPLTMAGVKNLSHISPGKKTAGILGIAALAGGGAAMAIQKKKARKACAAHMIDQLRQHNFAGKLLLNRVDGKPSSYGIQCAYYNTISNDPVVEEAAFNLYQYLPNTSKRKMVSLFEQYCKEKKRGQCNSIQTVCLDNTSKIC